MRNGALVFVKRWFPQDFFLTVVGKQGKIQEREDFRREKKEKKKKKVLYFKICINFISLKKLRLKLILVIVEIMSF